MPAEHPEGVNEGVPNAPYFQPATVPPAGTALSDKDWPQNKEVPLLFQPLTVGKTAKLELKNRILVAPMCNYSCEQDGPDVGCLTPYHLVHLGQFALRGAAVTMVEATSVLPNGRLSPNDSGLWNDRQASALKPIFDFIRTQGSIPAIQLGHGGRKTSTLAPWLDTSTIAPPLKSHVATNGRAGGWTDDVMAPSAISYDEETFPHPREMSLKDIDELKEAFRAATARADRAGAQVVELHAAHGYGIHNFLSPVSNKRTDQYGGSLENRMRLPLEILRIMRETLPKEKSLWMRISASDWWPEGEKDDKGDFISWGIEQSKIFVKEAIKAGIDLVDISSAGNTPRQKISVGPGYQVPFAEQIRASLTEEEKIPVSSVGLITNGKQAEDILQKGQADVISCAREFLRDPSLVLNWAQELDTVVNVPVQYQRAYTRMMTKPKAEQGESKKH
ncbi:hypothetical protein Rhopal_000709-T1 [Rhodotorula paludigena]|uniref:NADH:flavin oxidoreductase/NADH oxidase N-terminal domain-containing protein n=1 Tax=Rhodotorula paludigena TaxID=86838 RepID=A0AAV5GEI3_9BASI|nr:hypothetical protein Rhopal_000709-T1 [Rhodotorula paludigena]